MLRNVTATRYVTPLREGGSLPGVVEADDDGLYVLKFRGAGQGPKALAAELVAGEVARALGLPVPELVLVELDPALGAAEPDPEIQQLIAVSGGTNLGMDFLPGALPFTPARPPTAELAADVVWFDAFVLNVDRTPRNPNVGRGRPVRGAPDGAARRARGLRRAGRGGARGRAGGSCAPHRGGSCARLSRSSTRWCASSRAWSAARR